MIPQTKYIQNGSLQLGPGSLRREITQSIRWHHYYKDCMKARWLDIHFALILIIFSRSQMRERFLTCRTFSRLWHKKLRIPFCWWLKCLFCQRRGFGFGLAPQVNLNLTHAAAYQRLYRNSRHPTGRIEHRSSWLLRVTQRAILGSKLKAEESSCLY
jgi:hypothetical protein